MTSAWLVTAAIGAAGGVALATPGGRRPPLPRASRSRRPPALVVLAAGGWAVVALAGLRGVHLALVGVVAGAGWWLVRLASRARLARQAAVRRRLVVDYAEALAGELRAGQPLLTALERASPVWPETESVAAAARLDADVAAALRRLGALPGGAALRRLAGAWELCSATGAGLAYAVEQVVETARAEQRTAGLVQGELASARATARLVAAMPIVVLVAAQGMGARSWQFLVSSPAGVGCLALGVALALAGMAWIDRIAAGAVDGDA